MLFDYQLFLGLPLSEALIRELELLPQVVQDLFIQNASQEYLQKIEFEGHLYLGRYLGTAIETSNLETLEANIHSLIKKLLPHFAEQQQTLRLFACPIAEQC